MALDNPGKHKAMDGIVLGTVYVALHLSNGNELSGHGYSRKSVAAASWSVSSAGVASLSNLDVYTASDGSAQQAAKVSIWNSSTSTTASTARIYAPEDLTTTPAAPGNGATFRLTSLQLNP